MKARGCADATSTLKITPQNLKAANQDTFFLFVDTVKEFDSVNREMPWKILEKYGILKKTILVIKKMYTNIIIKLGIKKANAFFTSTSSVKQGDNLAPILFLFAIQATIDTMHRNWKAQNLSEPQLQYFLNESKGYLNKRSQKTGTTKTPFTPMMSHSTSSQKLTSSTEPPSFKNHLPKSDWKSTLDTDPTIQNQKRNPCTSLSTPTQKRKYWKS